MRPQQQLGGDIQEQGSSPIAVVRGLPRRSATLAAPFRTSAHTQTHVSSSPKARSSMSFSSSSASGSLS